MAKKKRVIIVTDQPRHVFSARSEGSLRGIHVDKVLVIVSRDFNMSDDVKRNIELGVKRRKGAIEYIYTDD